MSDDEKTNVIMLSSIVSRMNIERRNIMGLFGRKDKPISEMSDRELIRFIEKPGVSIAGKAAAIEEAISRGLTNPKTGQPYHY